MTTPHAISPALLLCTLLLAPWPAASQTLSPEAERAAPAAGPPFAWGDFTWMNGQSKQREAPLQIAPHVTMSLYLDTYYAFSSNRPLDNTLTGTASTGRHNELQLNLASVGLEWNHRNVIGRVAWQYGATLSLVQDLDGSVARGRSLSSSALRSLREASVGYHWDVLHGINLEAGIFMSYIGLESYLLAENWNYTRALVSEYTPFYFQGIRGQVHLTDRLKVEPWLVNGWQAYGKWNDLPSLGLSVRYNPEGSVALLGNLYVGEDTPGVATRTRLHHDNSVLWRYYDRPGTSGISKMAFSINSHLGFEAGGTGLPGPREALMVGTSIAHRVWFYDDLVAWTLRGEYVAVGTRYLDQFPPPLRAGQAARDMTVLGLTGTLSLMPRDFFEVRGEVVYRHASAPYFAGHAGTTSASGFVGGPTAGWQPQAVQTQALFIAAASFRL